MRTPVISPVIVVWALVCTVTLGRLLQLFHQHGVGLEFGHELNHGHMAHHTGQVDGGFHTGVATANHGHVFALEQGAVAVRAVGHAFVFVLGLAGHVHIAPARAGGQDDGLGS
jgi:hypothetical protein